MKKIPSILYGIIIITLASFSVDDCSIMRSGVFKYEGLPYENKVIIKGNEQIEIHKTDSLISTLKWVNDCEYNMTLNKITIPNFPYKIGDVLNVKINKVEGNRIFCTSTIYDNSWKTVFKKLQ